MTQTMYARDLRVIWWPEQQVFELPDGDAGSWTVYEGGYQRWGALDQEGNFCQDVSGGLNADETIRGIIGEPQPASEWEAYTLGRLIELGWMSGGFDADEDAALTNLALRGLAVQIEQDRRMVWRSTERGQAKAAMLGEAG